MDSVAVVALVKSATSAARSVTLPATARRPAMVEDSAADAAVVEAAMEVASVEATLVEVGSSATPAVGTVT